VVPLVVWKKRAEGEGEDGCWTERPLKSRDTGIDEYATENVNGKRMSEKKYGKGGRPGRGERKVSQVTIGGITR